MISGTAYGVILNDRRQCSQLEGQFTTPPYGQPPLAPVLYIKPRTCFSSGGASVSLPEALLEVEVAATIALLFDRDIGPRDENPASAIAAACLAIDVSEPSDSFYRPALVERCRDGFLPLGAFAAPPVDLAGLTIVTTIDGRDVHDWRLDRLVRGVDTLLRDIATFMTLSTGDALLVGLPGDAPRARAGNRINVSCEGLPTLTTRIEVERGL